MAKTSNVFARVEPEVKEQAENILEQLGIPMSNAIGIFLKQVVLQHGLPFDVKLPADVPVAFGLLSNEELNREIEKGFLDYQQGKVQDASVAFETLERELVL